MAGIYDPVPSPYLEEPKRGESGVRTIRSAGRGVLAAGGAIVGADEFANQQLIKANEQSQLASQTGTRITDITQVQGIEDIPDYLGGLIGQQLPIMATLVMGGPAALGARALAAKIGIKGISKTAAGMAGIGGSSSMLETGLIFPEVVHEAKINNPRGLSLREQAGVSVGGGILAGGAEAIPLLRVADRLGFGRTARRSLRKNVVKGVAKAGGEQALLEGGTEAFQTIVERGSRKFVNDNFEIFDEEGLNEILNAAAGGAIIGGGLGAITGGLQAALPGQEDSLFDDLAIEDEKSEFIANNFNGETNNIRASGTTDANKVIARLGAELVDPEGAVPKGFEGNTEFRDNQIIAMANLVRNRKDLTKENIDELISKFRSEEAFDEFESLVLDQDYFVRGTDDSGAINPEEQDILANTVGRIDASDVDPDAPYDPHILDEVVRITERKEPSSNVDADRASVDPQLDSQLALVEAAFDDAYFSDFADIEDDLASATGTNETADEIRGMGLEPQKDVSIPDNPSPVYQDAPEPAKQWRNDQRRNRPKQIDKQIAAIKKFTLNFSDGDREAAMKRARVELRMFEGESREEAIARLTAEKELLISEPMEKQTQILDAGLTTEALRQVTGMGSSSGLEGQIERDATVDRNNGSNRAFTTDKVSLRQAIHVRQTENGIIDYQDRKDNLAMSARKRLAFMKENFIQKNQPERAEALQRLFDESAPDPQTNLTQEEVFLDNFVVAQKNLHPNAISPVEKVSIKSVMGKTLRAKEDGEAKAPISAWSFRAKNSRGREVIFDALLIIQRGLEVLEQKSQEASEKNSSTALHSDFDNIGFINPQDPTQKQRMRAFTVGIAALVNEGITIPTVTKNYKGAKIEKLDLSPELIVGFNKNGNPILLGALLSNDEVTKAKYNNIAIKLRLPTINKEVKSIKKRGKEGKLSPAQVDEAVTKKEKEYAALSWQATKDLETIKKAEANNRTIKTDNLINALTRNSLKTGQLDLFSDLDIENKATKDFFRGVFLNTDADLRLPIQKGSPFMHNIKQPESATEELEFTGVQGEFTAGPAPRVEVDHEIAEIKTLNKDMRSVEKHIDEIKHEIGAKKKFKPKLSLISTPSIKSALSNEKGKEFVDSEEVVKARLNKAKEAAIQKQLDNHNNIQVRKLIAKKKKTKQEKEIVETLAEAQAELHEIKQELYGYDDNSNNYGIEIKDVNRRIPRIVGGDRPGVGNTLEIIDKNSDIGFNSKEDEPNKTATPTSVINLGGVKKAQEYARNNPDTSVYTLRVHKGLNLPHVSTNGALGNPWKVVKDPDLTRLEVGTTQEAVEKYEQWLNGAFPNIFTAHHKWLMKQIDSGFFNGKELVYYKNISSKDGSISHADVLAKFINKTTLPTSNKKGTKKEATAKGYTDFLTPKKEEVDLTTVKEIEQALDKLIAKDGKPQPAEALAEIPEEIVDKVSFTIPYVQSETTFAPRIEDGEVVSGLKLRKIGLTEVTTKRPKTPTNVKPDVDTPIVNEVLKENARLDAVMKAGYAKVHRVTLDKIVAKIAKIKKMKTDNPAQVQTQITKLNAAYKEYDTVIEQINNKTIRYSKSLGDSKIDIADQIIELSNFIANAENAGLDSTSAVQKAQALEHKLQTEFNVSDEDIQVLYQDGALPGRDKIRTSVDLSSALEGTTYRMSKEVGRPNDPAAWMRQADSKSNFGSIDKKAKNNINFLEHSDSFERVKWNKDHLINEETAKQLAERSIYMEFFTKKDLERGVVIQDKAWDDAPQELVETDSIQFMPDGWNYINDVIESRIGNFQWEVDRRAQLIQDYTVHKQTKAAKNFKLKKAPAFKPKELTAEEVRQNAIVKSWSSDDHTGTRLGVVPPALNKAFQKIGFFVFANNVEDIGWGSRSSWVAKRSILTDYLDKQDIFTALKKDTKGGDHSIIRPSEVYLRALISKRAGVDYQELLGQRIDLLPSKWGYAKAEYDNPDSTAFVATNASGENMNLLQLENKQLAQDQRDKIRFDNSSIKKQNKIKMNASLNNEARRELIKKNKAEIISNSRALEHRSGFHIVRKSKSLGDTIARTAANAVAKAGVELFVPTGTPLAVQSFINNEKDILAGWAKQLGIKVPNLQSTTLKNIRGLSVSKENMIALNINLTNAVVRVETMAHEVGHIILDNYVKAQPKARMDAVHKDFLLWRKKQLKDNNTVAVVNKSKKTFNAAMDLLTDPLANIRLNKLTKDQLEYVLDFHEWFADQTSRYLTNITKAEGFFQGLARKIKEFFGVIKDDYNTKRSVQDLLDGIVNTNKQTMISQFIDTAAKAAKFPKELLDQKPATIWFSAGLIKKSPFSESAVEAFEKIFEKEIDPETKALLSRAVNRKKVKRDLYKLLEADSSLVTRANNSETSKIAYAYQAYNADMLNLQPQAINAFQRVYDFIHDIAGTLQDHKQAERIFGFIRDPAIGVSGYKLRDKLKETMSQKGAGSIIKAYKKLIPYGEAVFSTADSRMHATGNPHLIKIANLINARTSQSEGVKQSMLEGRKERIGEFVNRWHNIYNKVTPAQAKEALELLQNTDKFRVASNKLPAKQLASAVHNQLFRMRKYGERKKLIIGDKGREYFPWVFDIRYVQDHSDDFKELLSHPAYVTTLQKIADQTNKDYLNKLNKELVDSLPKDAPNIRLLTLKDLSVSEIRTVDQIKAQILETLIGADGLADTEINSDLFGSTPFMSSIQKRSLAFLDSKGTKETREQLAKFFDKNIDHTMITYIHQLVKRAEYTSRFGARGEFFRQMLQDAREFGATEKDERLAGKYLEASLGTLGIGTNRKLTTLLGGTPVPGQVINPKLQVFNSAVILTQNLAILSLATFTSLVDPVGIGVRGGSINEPLAALKAGMAEIAAKANGKRTVLREMAEALGTIEDKMTDEALAWEYESTWMSPKIRWVNDKFFKVIGLTQWTRFSRLMALGGAEAFLKKHANMDSDLSDRYMKELGLKRNDVVLKKGKLELLTHVERDNLLTTAGEQGRLTVEKDDRVRTALNRFVDEAILRPNSSLRPIWASDPHFALIFHLKSFMYGFHERIIRRSFNELAEGQMAPMLMLMMFVPMMIMADLLRDAFTGFLGKDLSYKSNWTIGDYTWSALQRSGVTGLGQMAIEAHQNFKYGGIGIESMLGPAAQNLLLDNGNIRIDDLFFNNDKGSWDVVRDNLPFQNSLLSSLPKTLDGPFIDEGFGN